jgi:hypothetical protein
MDLLGIDSVLEKQTAQEPCSLRLDLAYLATAGLLVFFAIIGWSGKEDNRERSLAGAWPLQWGVQSLSLYYCQL